MLSRARSLSDQQNALVRRFEPFGGPFGQQFSQVEAPFFAASFMQRDRHHYVHFHFSAAQRELDKLAGEPIRQRIDLLEFQQHDGTYQRVLIANHAAALSKRKPCNRQVAQSGSKLRAGSLSESSVNCDSIGSPQTFQMLAPIRGKEAATRRKWAVAWRERAALRIAGQGEMPRRVETASDKGISSPEAYSSRLDN